MNSDFLVRDNTKTTIIEVAVGIIIHDGSVLIARRKANQVQGGCWEFPGGKRHADESGCDCVVRECREELGIEVRCAELLLTLDHTYDYGRVCIECYRCDHIGGSPQPHASEELRWVPIAELDGYRFPPANGPLLARLRVLV